MFNWLKQWTNATREKWAAQDKERAAQERHAGRQSRIETLTFQYNSCEEQAELIELLKEDETYYYDRACALRDRVGRNYEHGSLQDFSRLDALGACTDAVRCSVTQEEAVYARMMPEPMLEEVCG